MTKHMSELDVDGHGSLKYVQKDKYTYSPEGAYIIYKDNGAWYHFNLDTFDGTGIYSNSLSGVGQNNSSKDYTNMVVSAENYNSVERTWTLTLKVWVAEKLGTPKELIVTVDECGGIIGITPEEYSLTPPTS